MEKVIKSHFQCWRDDKDFTLNFTSLVYFPGWWLVTEFELEGRTATKGIRIFRVYVLQYDEMWACSRASHSKVWRELKRNSGISLLFVSPRLSRCLRRRKWRKSLVWSLAILPLVYMRKSKGKGKEKRKVMFVVLELWVCNRQSELVYYLLVYISWEFDTSFNSLYCAQ